MESPFHLPRALSINLTGRGFDTWLQRVVKLFVQEEVMRGKVEQVVHHQASLPLEAGPWAMVPAQRLASFFPALDTEQDQEAEQGQVGARIQEYRAWLRSVVQPTNDEVKGGGGWMKMNESLDMTIILD